MQVHHCSVAHVHIDTKSNPDRGLDPASFSATEKGMRSHQKCYTRDCVTCIDKNNVGKGLWEEDEWGRTEWESWLDPTHSHVQQSACNRDGNLSLHPHRLMELRAILMPYIWMHLTWTGVHGDALWHFGGLYSS